jgi:hypothetical protein
MAENRKPPAYQEYASTMLANISFRSMDLAQRGLLYTMRLECWANESLPSNVDTLSNVLGQNVKPEHLKAVQPFFQIDESTIISPELNDYRQHLEERREKQRRGGRKGANKTNSKAKSSEKTESSGNPRVSRRGSCGSLVQSNPEKQSQNQRNEGKFSYKDKDGVDPLDSELHTPTSECNRCNGEGCGWCGG